MQSKQGSCKPRPALKFFTPQATKDLCTPLIRQPIGFQNESQLESKWDILCGSVNTNLEHQEHAQLPPMHTQYQELTLLALLYSPLENCTQRQIQGQQALVISYFWYIVYALF